MRYYVLWALHIVHGIFIGRSHVHLSMNRNTGTQKEVHRVYRPLLARIDLKRSFVSSKKYIKKPYKRGTCRSRPNEERAVPDPKKKPAAEKLWRTSGCSQPAILWNIDIQCWARLGGHRKAPVQLRL